MAITILHQVFRTKARRVANENLRSVQDGAWMLWRSQRGRKYRCEIRREVRRGWAAREERTVRCSFKIDSKPVILNRGNFPPSLLGNGSHLASAGAIFSGYNLRLGDPSELASTARGAVSQPHDVHTGQQP